MLQATQLDSSALASLIDQVRSLRISMSDFEQRHSAALKHVAPAYRASARNLLHYVAMRRQDVRPLQTMLAALGLSSLGRAEACALSSVSAVLNALQHLVEVEPQHWRDLPCDLGSGVELLNMHTNALFGSSPHHDSTRIMVTMPSEAATDYGLVHELLEAGMSCMRVNCAHDRPEDWDRMIQHLRQASAGLNRPCSILMDLGGPKLRTGRIEAGPAVLKVRPKRDACGRVTAPVRLWLHAHHESPPSPAEVSLHVDAKWIAEVQIGDQVRFEDIRGRHRVLRIIDSERAACGPKCIALLISPMASN